MAEKGLAFWRMRASLGPRASVSKKVVVFTVFCSRLDEDLGPDIAIVVRPTDPPTALAQQSLPLVSPTQHSAIFHRGVLFRNDCLGVIDLTMAHEGLQANVH